MPSQDSFGAKSTLDVDGKSYEIYRLDAVTGDGLDVASLPFSLKVLLENLLRTEDGANITADDIRALAGLGRDAEPDKEIQFTPARVIMQDFTGVPCVVDLATMREAMDELGGDPSKINPLAPAEMVIDHSVIADVFGTPEAFERNVEIEYERNRERYQFLRWGQGAFDDFKVVPPGTGIVHQVNIEHLARIVFTREVDGETLAYPDTCVGTDSHTTMVNGIGVVGWGVGGIEAEAAMLGQPVSMLIPRVVGFKLSGELPEGATATDLVLTITEMLRKHGVVGKFVEFYGEGVSALPLANRATIGNMSPEFGSTIAVFPIDERDGRLPRLTGRPEEQLALVEAYAKEQGLWHDPAAEPRYSEKLELDVSTVVPCLAGPKRPQDRVALTDAKASFRGALADYVDEDEQGYDEAVAESFPASDSPSPRRRQRLRRAARQRRARRRRPAAQPGHRHPRGRHRVRARPRRGHHRRDHLVHQHLQPVGDDRRRAAGQEGRREGPAAQAVGQDHAGPGLEGRLGLLRAGRPDAVPRQARLQPRRLRLHDLHRQLRPADPRGQPGRQRQRPRRRLGAVGQPQLRGPDQPRRQDELPRVAAAGRRLRAGRLDGRRPLQRPARPGRRRQRRLPPRHLALAGRGRGDHRPGDHLGDVRRGLRRRLRRRRALAVAADPGGRHLRVGRRLDLRPQGRRTSTGMPEEPTPVTDIEGARVLLKLGDSVTTDHISPAGAIKKDSPAGSYLAEHGVEQRDFNSYGSRRGNHEVMIRGTFANIRLRNQLAPGTEGGVTRDFTNGGEVTTVYDASEHYVEAGTPLVVLAGKEYGSGSSRDWAAKGTALLGVKAVIAESYERIHRSNLIGMGVLPLQYPEGENAESLGLTGEETFSITGVTALNDGRTPKTVQGQGRRRRVRRRGAHRHARVRRTTTGTAASCSTCCATCSRAEPAAAE